MPSKKRERPRYVVADLGFAFAVHDTRAPRPYEFEAGRDKAHPSNNLLNTQRVAICATRQDAQRIADELNRGEDGGRRQSRAS